MVSKAMWMCVGAADQGECKYNNPKVLSGSHTLWLYNLSVEFHQAEEGPQNG